MSVKTHFRRCHQCDTLNWARGYLVTTCHGCRKHLAPFYFFDESRALGLNPSKLYSTEVNAETKLPHKEYPPIRGLTVYWEF